MNFNFIYQKSNRYFAQTDRGLEDAAAHEIESLGGAEIRTGFLGLSFGASREALYSIVYQARLISRVLAPVISFDCHSDKYLYNTLFQIPWEDFITIKQTLAVSANVSDSKINHSQYAALKCKDAIVDRIRHATGKRPDINPRQPDIRIHLYMRNNKAVLYWDASGDALHKRGYRHDAVEAPMRETVAAAIIEMSGWHGQNPLYDPMCGSGTLLCEAWMKVSSIPSGFLRSRFGFETLPDYDAKSWQHVQREADSKMIQSDKNLISGSDISEKAVKAARINCRKLPAGERIHIGIRPFDDIESLENVTIITNPPYGIRMGHEEQLKSMIKAFGDFMKNRCKGSSAYLYFGNRELIKSVGLKPAWKKPLTSGGLDGRLVKYELY